MNRAYIRLATVMLIGAAYCLLSACQSMSASPIDERSSLDGLQRVKKSGIDAVFRRPGADLSKYSKLLVHSPEIEFSKNWNPESNSVLYRMNKVDREKIKTELAMTFVDVFRRVLQDKGDYQLVDEAGPDVLDVQSAIINLYISAPDVSMQTAGRVKTYTADAGEMTLVAEFRDSVTGALLSRVYDRRDNLGSGSWEWTNSVTNVAEARTVITSWATTLRKALDAAHAPKDST